MSDRDARFTKDTAAWLKQVARDRSLPRGVGAVAIMLALEYRNRQTWKAWPSVVTLAADVGMTRPGVQKTLRALQDGGHLDCEIGAGPYGANVYTFLLKAQTDVGAPPPTGISTPPPTDVGSQRVDARQRTFPNPPTDVSEPANGRWHNLSDEPLDEPPDERVSATSSQQNASKRKGEPLPEEEIDRDFEEWWPHSPLKKEKLRARAAYGKARKRASREDLLLGIMRYAGEVEGRDPRYIKHPSTWLNAGCWQDEPAEPPAGRPNGRDRPMSATEAAELRLQAIDEGKWG